MVLWLKLLHIAAVDMLAEIKAHQAAPLLINLVRDGKVERIVTDEQIDHAVNKPPETTRAIFRGRFVKLANERKILCGVNWNYIQLYEPYQKLFLSADPLQSEYEEGQRPVSTSVQ